MIKFLSKLVLPVVVLLVFVLISFLTYEKSCNMMACDVNWGFPITIFAPTGAEGSKIYILGVIINIIAAFFVSYLLTIFWKKFKK